MAYRTVTDGEWIEPASKFKLQCCDCGLVHNAEYRITQNASKIRIKFIRNRRSTAAVRRHMKK